MASPLRNVAKTFFYLIFIALTVFILVTFIPSYLGLGGNLLMAWYLVATALLIAFISDLVGTYITGAKYLDMAVIALLFIASLFSSSLALANGWGMVPTIMGGGFVAVIHAYKKNWLITGISGIIIGQLLMFFGYVLTAFSQLFGGPYPPNLLVAIGVGISVFQVIDYSVKSFAAGYGGAPDPRILQAFSIGLAFIIGFSFFFTIVLEGDWDNTEAVSGEVLYGVGNAITTVGGAVTDQVEAYTNVQLNPSRNPTLARMSCTMSIYFGGGVIGETNPDQLIANCVDDKLGRNETEAESDRVTEPVRIQVQEIELEPYSDRVNVVVPILNNLVRDINGRAINVDARNIRVNIKMERNGQTVASMEKAGEVETIEQLASGGDQIIEHSFPTFAIVGSATDAQIEQWLLRLQDCHQSSENGENGDSGDSGDGSGDGSSCESELNQFLNAFDSGDLTKARVSYVNRVRVGITEASAKSYGLVEDVGDDEESDLIPTEMWNRENNIAPDRTYTVLVNVQYDFAAEAAFTQASRWQSGDYLLELWDPVAWDELSFEARQNWESRNCNALTRYGQEVERQRTAALTTPVVPVMYTECGNTLFRRDNYYEDLRINIGATVHDEFSDGLKEDRGFMINEAETDCGEGTGMQDIVDDIGGEQDEEGWYVHQEGVGFVVDPANVTRNIGSIPGDTMTIGCRATMDFTVNFETQTSYEVPNLQ